MPIWTMPEWTNKALASPHFTDIMLSKWGSARLIGNNWCRFAPPLAEASGEWPLVHVTLSGYPRGFRGARSS